MIYALCLTLIMTGIYGVVVRKNLVKIIVSFVIIEYGINLLLVLIGYRFNGAAPILDAGMRSDPEELAVFMGACVDPLPQAMVLTAIVIHLGVLALMVAVCIRLYERHGTFDISQIRKLHG